MSLNSKIPDLGVALCFVPFECIIKPQKNVDEDKFHKLIAKLGFVAVQQHSDFLADPPANHK